MNTTEVKDLKADIISSFSQATFGEANEYRARAIANLDQFGLPGNKTEEYRFAPVTRNLERVFEWRNEITPYDVKSLDPFLIPDFDANLIVFVNGTFSKSLSSITSPGKEVEVLTLQDAFQNQKERISPYFDKLVSSEKDPFAALNTALWQEGILIHVPKNTTVEKPFLILHINDSRQSQVIAHTRLLTIVEEDSQISVVEKFDSIGESPVFHTFTEEVVVKENAQLHYTRIQNDTGKSYQVANTVIHQSNSSKVNTFTFTFDGQLVRNNFQINVDGEQCESHFYGLYLLNNNTLADNHTVVDHKKPNSISNELYKGVMNGNAKGVFNGKIFVRPDAQHTNAFQSNRNILLSDTASVNTKPQLEIWADDVKCSHGCTTGQLDDEALFYLRSRGIERNSAQAMLLYAFAGEVLDEIQNEQLKNYLERIVSEKLSR